MFENHIRTDTTIAVTIAITFAIQNKHASNREYINNSSRRRRRYMSLLTPSGCGSGPHPKKDVPNIFNWYGRTLVVFDKHTSSLKKICATKTKTPTASLKRRKRGLGLPIHTQLILKLMNMTLLGISINWYILFVSIYSLLAIPYWLWTIGYSLLS